mmetsp:Transcript_40840/g.94667  ORF Transcript_40840/g.94667 Transcript_40840/m.94667 type:complete len:218 (-) Transcript_40840:241-894(-)
MRRAHVAKVATKLASQGLDHGCLARAWDAVEEVGPFVRDAVLQVELAGLVRQEFRHIINHLLGDFLWKHHAGDWARNHPGDALPVLALDVPAVDLERVLRRHLRLGKHVRKELSNAPRRRVAGAFGEQHEALEHVRAARRANRVPYKLVQQLQLGAVVREAEHSQAQRHADVLHDWTFALHTAASGPAALRSLLARAALLRGAHVKSGSILVHDGAI